jgi:hypothetical protein
MTLKVSYVSVLFYIQSILLIVKFKSNMNSNIRLFIQTLTQLFKLIIFYDLMNALKSLSQMKSEF